MLGAHAFRLLEKFKGAGRIDFAGSDKDGTQGAALVTGIFEFVHDSQGLSRIGSA